MQPKSSRNKNLFLFFCINSFFNSHYSQQILLIILMKIGKNAQEPLAKDRANRKKNSMFTGSQIFPQQKANSNWKFSQVPKVSQYAAIDKLRLSKEVLQNIKNTLEIEQVSKHGFQQRMKEGNFYINYQQNPFTKSPVFINPTPIQRPKRSISRTSSNILKPKDKSIIDSLNRLRDQPNVKDNIQIQSINNSDASQVHRLMRQKDKNRENDHYIRKKSNLFAEQKENRDLIEKSVDHFNDFDRILTLRQQNFYEVANDHKLFNIFRIARSSDSGALLCYDSLKEIYFCQDSPIYKNAVKVSDAFQSISYVARMRASGSYQSISTQHKIFPADIKAILEEIKFRDLLMISSGMIESDILEAYLENEGLSGQKDEDGSLITDKQQEILYRDAQNNAQTNFIVEKHDKAEIQIYINNTLTIMEAKQQQLSAIHKQKIIQILQQEQHCSATNVHDRPLRGLIKQKAKEVLVKQFDDQIRKHSGPIDRIIRLNKLEKDKVEKIKNLAVIETIKIQKQFQQKLKSKSKSPHHQSFSNWK